MIPLSRTKVGITLIDRGEGAATVRKLARAELKPSGANLTPAAVVGDFRADLSCVHRTFSRVQFGDRLEENTRCEA